MNGSSPWIGLFAWLAMLGIVLGLFFGLHLDKAGKFATNNLTDGIIDVPRIVVGSKVNYGLSNNTFSQLANMNGLTEKPFTAGQWSRLSDLGKTAGTASAPVYTTDVHPDEGIYFGDSIVSTSVSGKRQFSVIPEGGVRQGTDGGSYRFVKQISNESNFHLGKFTLSGQHDFYIDVKVTLITAGANGTAAGGAYHFYHGVGYSQATVVSVLEHTNAQDWIDVKTSGWISGTYATGILEVGVKCDGTTDDHRTLVIVEIETNQSAVSVTGVVWTAPDTISFATLASPGTYASEAKTEYYHPVQFKESVIIPVAVDEPAGACTSGSIQVANGNAFICIGQVWTQFSLVAP